ncbi:MAG TPA: uroporphyrinogen-III C-methyltransferase [Burkholderiaceae bacterium]
MNDAMTTAAHPVHLVGAGPGDPELLTLKALRVLRQASVILVDDLVGEQVLAAALDGLGAPPRVVRVGKRGGCASTPQEFIEKLMVREALAGERVVRLKGGDPLVFGRAGEEIAALRAAGIDVEIVNGITSGLAAAGSAGIGWTDRRAGAQGVLLVTGHAGQGCEEPDWDAIARVAAAGVTLVVYMGVARAEAIVERLRTALPGELPVAIVQRATGADEVIARTTLGGLVDTIRTEAIASPAILVIGRVAAEARVPVRLPEDVHSAHPTNWGRGPAVLTLRGLGRWDRGLGAEENHVAGADSLRR